MKPRKVVVVGRKGGVSMRAMRLIEALKGAGHTVQVVDSDSRKLEGLSITSDAEIDFHNVIVNPANWTPTKGAGKG